MSKKYNPNGLNLFKSKMIKKAAYTKGTFITDVNKLADIVINGAEVEVKSQEVRLLGDIDVQVIECRIFFIPI